MLKINLSHASNPDLRHGYWGNGNRDAPSCMAEVASIAQAQAAAREYIDTNGLGAGNWTGGEVTNAAGEVVANISYNGRAWAPDGSEIDASTAALVDVHADDVPEAPHG